MEVIMWLGQAKFFCTQCGKEVTDNIRGLIEQRCKTLSIDPVDLGEKAREAVNAEMLREMGEEPANALEVAFIKATALLLLEITYSPTLLCDQCRSLDLHEGPGEAVKLRLIKGGKAESQ
jgi:endogenous inhibitor of DNA gyrase (YacG/DUF329 family)